VAGSLEERGRRQLEANTRTAGAGGFNEFYDPIGGRPVGRGQFGWATLAAVM